MINAMNIQGVPSVIGLIQDLQTLPRKHQKPIEKLFTRYFRSELTFEDRCIAFSGKQDSFALLRNLSLMEAKTQTWKSDRGFLVAESVRPN